MKTIRVYRPGKLTGLSWVLITNGTLTVITGTAFGSFWMIVLGCVMLGLVASGWLVSITDRYRSEVQMEVGKNEYEFWHIGEISD